MLKHKLISHTEFLIMVHELANKIKESEIKFSSLFGVPRGGLVVAVYLSHLLDIPVTIHSIDDETLIVDDISDTGKTLSGFKHENYIATLHYKKGSIVEPAFWVRKKKDKWIVYPWEIKT